MTEAAVTKKHGLFAVENFLDRNLCAELYLGIKNSVQMQSPIYESVGKKVVSDTKHRPKLVLNLEEKYHQNIKSKLSELKPQFEDYFDFKLNSLQEPYFVVYKTGDSIAKHVDAMETDITKEYGDLKKLNIIIFLNDETEETEENCYGGGNLTFYGLFKNEMFDKFGYPIKGKAGKLIAFPASILHEVTPVEHGTRYVISSGYY